MSQQKSNPISDMARNGVVEHLFSTPVFSYVLRDADDLNAELRDLILAREGKGPSMTKSNQGGWQSLPDFFRWGHPAIARIEEILACAVDIATSRVHAGAPVRLQFEVYGWAAVNRTGHYNSPHVHPMATWSGVYYVDPGDEPPDAPGALLEFVHPITASVMTFFPGILPSARTVRPVPGLIILFPSYLQHAVRMYRGTRPRICIAFNAHMRMGGTPSQ